MHSDASKSKEADMTTTYVLYIEFGKAPPRVAVFDTFDEAEERLDVFEVSVFDPPQNDHLDYTLLRARIFECKSDSGSWWGTEIDIKAFRRSRWLSRFNETERQQIEEIERQQHQRYDLWCADGD
jgi:hypothetical protein